MFGKKRTYGNLKKKFRTELVETGRTELLMKCFCLQGAGKKMHERRPPT